MLVLDDSTLDKPYATKIDLVTRHWSGKHHAVVRGINLTTLLWTDGDRHIPCDYRLYDHASDGLTKNDHFRAMLHTAHARGFAPDCVAFDGRYSALENLKLIRRLGWRWLTRLKINRRVNLNRRGSKAVGETAIEAGGTVVYLEGFGPIRVFRIVSRDGDAERLSGNREFSWLMMDSTVVPTIGRSGHPKAALPGPPPRLRTLGGRHGSAA